MPPGNARSRFLGIARVLVRFRGRFSVEIAGRLYRNRAVGFIDRLGVRSHMAEADERNWGSGAKEKHDDKGNCKVPIETSLPQR